MNTKEKLLKHLMNSSDFTSGEDIATYLGISRSAVWKYIKQLSLEGIKIESKQNKGYKIAESINFINKIILDDMLDDDFYDISVFNSLPSSNTYLKDHGEEYDSGKVVFAREQTSGRGRLDRFFYSPADTGIYFSILVKPNKSVSSSIYLTVLSAVSVLEGVKDALGISLKIKWVNDLYKDNKKVVGILAEGLVNIDYNTLQRCVIGIGINVYNPDGLANDIKSLATTLSSKKEDLNKIAVAILKRFKEHYLEYLNDDYSFIKTYQEMQLLNGKSVKSVNLATEEVKIVKVIKVNDDCSLMVENENGEIENINSGEVRIIINK